jgi:hypothetical protein
MTSPVPPEYTGLWCREVITAPGFRDETTQVLWLQTASWYVDLRVPADRPGVRGAAGFADYSAAELAELGKIQGFAGELAAADGICLWRRDFDRQPPGPIPDEARCAVEDDVMIEDGLHADYQEIWRRVAGSEGPLAAFSLAEPAGPGGLLVMAGDHLMEFRARSGPALVGASLGELVEARLSAGDRAGAEGLLETQIRYAVRQGEGWRVRLSSHPWREGRLMWPAGGARFDAASGRLQVWEGEGTSLWRLLDANVPREALGRLIAGAQIVPAAP